MILRAVRRPSWRTWRVPLLTVGLLFLLEQVHFEGPIVRLDFAVRHWVTGQDFPVSGYAAELIVDVANPPLVVAMLGILVVVLTAQRDSLQPVALGVTAVVLLSTAVLGLKYGVARPGPASWGQGVAWPSGHTTTAVVACGVLAQLIGTERRCARMVLMVIPALVGLSLVLRDYHWLSDVLAGWLLGSLLLIATPALATWLMGMQRSASDAAISRGQVGAESPPGRKALG